MTTTIVKRILKYHSGGEYVEKLTKTNDEHECDDLRERATRQGNEEEQGLHYCALSPDHANLARTANFGAQVTPTGPRV